MTRFTFWLCLLVSISCLFGCRRIARVKQCQALTKTINTAMDDVESLSALKPRNKALKQVSERYRQLAAELGPLSFNEEMAKDVARYRTSVLEAADLTRDMSRPNRSRTLENGNKNKLSRIKQEQGTHIAKFNRWCKAN